MKKLIYILTFIAFTSAYAADLQIGREKLTGRLDYELATARSNRISLLEKSLADSCIMGVTFNRDNGTNLYDVFGVGTIATVTNATMQPVWTTNSVKMDGVNDKYVISPITNYTAGTFSFMTWVKIPDTALQGIFCNGTSDANTEFVFDWYIDASRKLVSTYAHNGNVALGTTTMVSVATVTTGWVMLGQTVSNSAVIKFWTNGVSTAFVLSGAPNVCTFKIGTKPLPLGSYRYNDNLFPFKGFIGDHYFFNKCLSAEEVTNLFQRTRGKYGI